MANMREVMYNLGNRKVFQTIWTYAGTFSVAASFFFMYDEAEDALPVALAVMSGAFVFLSLVPVLKHTPLLRTNLMRVERGWIWSSFMNYIVTIITTLVLVNRRVTLDGLWAQCLIGFAFFCLMELTKPVADYGLLQFVLRLPLQTAVILVFVDHHDCHGGHHHAAPWTLLIAPSLLMLFCTIWQSVYLHAFEHALRAEDIQRDI